MWVDKAESVEEALGVSWSLEDMVYVRRGGRLDGYRNLTKKNCGLFVPSQRMAKGHAGGSVVRSSHNSNSLQPPIEKSPGVHVETFRVESTALLRRPRITPVGKYGGFSADRWGCVLLSSVRGLDLGVRLPRMNMYK
jgi:hypothetical protein